MIGHVPFSLLVLVTMLTVSACQTGAVRQSERSAPENTQASPAKVYIDLANAYHAAGERTFALENARKAIRADDRNPHAQAIYAYMKRLSGNPQGSDALFTSALRMAPEDPYVLGLYGLFLCSKGEVAAADQAQLAAATSTRNLSPWKSYMNAAICYEESGDFVTAHARLKSAQKHNQNSPQVSQALTRVERKLHCRSGSECP